MKLEKRSFHPVVNPLHSLRNGKASGIDGFTAQTLKNNLDFFVPVLQHLVGLIFRQGKYPTVLKKASVIVVHEKGDVEDLGTYRPISLLSVFNRVIERLIAKEVISHLERNRILSDLQFGFRARRSTQDAVLFVQIYVLEELEIGRVPVCIFLDFSSAFDCVPHSRLIRKLECAGITGAALRVLSSYLSGRTQQLKGLGSKSDFTAVDRGVPQGGSLSSIFFSLYINDLLLRSNDVITDVGYADDISLLSSARREIDWKLLENVMRRVIKWSRVNELLLNVKKSNYPKIPVMKNAIDSELFA